MVIILPMKKNWFVFLVFLGASAWANDNCEYDVEEAMASFEYLEEIVADSPPVDLEQEPKSIQDQISEILQAERQRQLGLRQQLLSGKKGIAVTAECPQRDLMRLRAEICTEMSHMGTNASQLRGLLQEFQTRRLLLLSKRIVSFRVQLGRDADAIESRIEFQRQLFDEQYNQVADYLAIARCETGS